MLVGIFCFIFGFLVGCLVMVLLTKEIMKRKNEEFTKEIINITEGVSAIGDAKRSKVWQERNYGNLVKPNAT